MPTPAEPPVEHGETGAWSWHHAGLVVRRLDAAIEFYREALGYRVEFLVRDMDDQFQRTVGVPGVVCDLAQLVAPFTATRLELLEVRGVPAGTPPHLPVHVGVGHGAYQVRDLDAAVARLFACGGAPIGEIVEFSEGRAVYCWTPSGTVVELEEAWI
ncbi:VOC family protein [Microbacterium sp. SORGH_AS_0888]|uniref:VOC family protein n=1 Tax=Microbacterium sp. SORGH_AS_0888 TaxID=3041791 RepID=UPI0027865278|nr:VOC family protein [Microbacterium sp. SORGH_AS_0888]MDQ1130485.1 catechol 2,3-dioxygenase-like lactoylglutathione lyase family enzyme [Microbacterium sp. SORGH_AS_0888]